MGRSSARLVPRALVAIVIGILATSLIAPAVALAHATLESTDPAAGAVLDQSPSVITLKFSEAVDISLGAVRLFDGAGKAIDVGTAEHPGGQASVVQISVPQLADGSYVVDWRVVSADSHPIEGAFTFQVGQTANLQPGVIGDIVSREPTDRAAGTALTITRGVVTAAIALVFGGLLAIALGIADTSRRNRLIVIVSAVIGGIFGLLQLPLEVAYATGRSMSAVFDGGAWSDALDTRVGVAWLVRALLIGVVGVVLAVTMRHREQMWWRSVLVAALLGVGVASAFGGHGATGRWHDVGIVTTVIHVAAMAAWLGGLVLVLCDVTRIDGHRLHLFSTLAAIAILLVTISGVVQAIRQLGSLDALTNTHYGILLMWKVAFVLLVVAVAAVSRRLVWRAELDRPRLQRTLAMEVVGAVAIVVVTAMLMGANPSQALTNKPFSAQLVDNGYLASITIEPGRVGLNEMHLYLSNPQSSLTEPDDLHVQISDPSRGVAPIDVAMVRSGASHYTAPNLTFPYSATWTLTVAARYNTFDAVQFTTKVPIP